MGRDESLLEYLFSVKCCRFVPFFQENAEEGKSSWSISLNSCPTNHPLQILVHFLINMSLGMVTALVGFAFSLWSLIRSFSPDFLTGLLFFAGALVSASALVATYLTLLYGTAIGTVVVGVKMAVAAANRRIEAGEGGQPRRNLHYE